MLALERGQERWGAGVCRLFQEAAARVGGRANRRNRRCIISTLVPTKKGGCVFPPFPPKPAATPFVHTRSQVNMMPPRAVTGDVLHALFAATSGSKEDETILQASNVARASWQ